MRDLTLEIDAKEFKKKLGIKDGKDGVNGEKGEKGDKGEPGESIVGPQGIQGIQGLQGESGKAITPEEVRDKLKELKTPHRLNLSDLDGLDRIDDSFRELAKGFTPRAMSSLYDVELSNLTDGQVLKWNDSKKKFINGVGSSSGGASISRVVTSISSPTTAGADALTDYVYLVSGTTTLTMPTAVGNTNLYTIKNVGSGVVTVATTGGQTIDNGSTAVLQVRYTSIDLVSDGSNWEVT